MRPNSKITEGVRKSSGEDARLEQRWLLRGVLVDSKPGHYAGVVLFSAIFNIIEGEVLRRGVVIMGGGGSGQNSGRS